MRLDMLGEKAADVNVAMAKRKIGDCYTEMEDYENAEKAYLEAIEIRKAAVGSEVEKNCSLANTKHNLSDCFIRSNELLKASSYARDSFIHAEKALLSGRATDSPRIVKNAIALVPTITHKVVDVSQQDISQKDVYGISSHIKGILIKFQSEMKDYKPQFVEEIDILELCLETLSKHRQNLP